MSNRIFKSFNKSESGVVAPLTAISFVLLLVVAAVAIDYTRATNKQSDIQDAADSAALAYLTRYIESGDESEAKKVAESIFKVNLNGTSISDFTVGPIRTEDGYLVVDVTSKSQSKGTLGGSLGSDATELGVYARATIPVRSMSTTVVTDISWSMRNNMGHLRQAVEEFGRQMYDLPSTFTDRLDMALVPYAGSVNIKEASNRSDRLIQNNVRYKTDDSFDPDSKKYYKNYENCNNQHRKHEVMGVDYRGRNTRINVQEREWREVVTGHRTEVRGVNTVQIPIREMRCESNGVIREFEWAGCVEIASNETVNWAGAVGDNSRPPMPHTQHKIHNMAHCPDSPMRGNIRSFSQFRSAARSLESNFSTAHDIGMMWGARTLEPAWSSFFGRSSRPWNSDDHPKYLLYFSDGKSINVGYTHHAYIGRGDDDITNNTKSICNNLKSRGVTIYSISYVTPAKPNAIEVVEDCASEGKHFTATQANLSKTFEEIAVAIKTDGLRLSR